MKSHRKKKKQASEALVELNVMPFIDIFSLLCTFLLFSAVFISFGVHTVQVPFLSNAAEEKKDEDQKEKRVIEVTVEIRSTKVDLVTKWSAPPLDTEVKSFENSEDGLNDLNDVLISIKKNNYDASKLTMLIEDDVNYEKISHVIDAVSFASEGKDNLSIDGKQIKDLFPKIVFGSVIL